MSVSFGTNTNVVKKRVKFVNTNSSAAVTLYAGMPLCYQFDTTTNVLGWDKENSEEGTTTAEGYQNEGKFMIVDLPDDDNIHAFAGVAVANSWTGSSTVADDESKWLDVYIPNGAIVPVRTDQSCTVGRTILAIHNAEQHLTGPYGTAGRPVAVAWETNTDVDGDAGLVLAKLDPNMFLYQKGDAAALVIDDQDDGNDFVLNNINVTTAQTDGRFTAFEIKAAITSTASSQSGGCGYGLALYTETSISGILSGSQNASVSHWTNLNAGADLTSQFFGMEIGIYESGADLSGCGFFAPLCLRMQIDGTNGPTAKRQYQMYLRSDGGGSHPDGLFAAYTVGSIGMVTKSSAAVSHVIPIEIEHGGGAGTYYLMVSDAA